MKFRQKDCEPGFGYAWSIEDGRGGWQLCSWVEPSIEGLERRSRPSPEAQIVSVRIEPRTCRPTFNSPEGR